MPGRERTPLAHLTHTRKPPAASDFELIARRPARAPLGAGPAPSAAQDIVRLQRVYGNRAVTQFLSQGVQRAPAQPLIQRADGEEEAVDPAPAPAETWGQWLVRHRWKIGAGAAAIALGGLYLYYRSRPGETSVPTTTAPSVPAESPVQLAQMAQQGVQSATPTAVETAVKTTTPGTLGQFGLKVVDDTVGEVADVLTGNAMPSIARGTARALRQGLESTDAFDLAHSDPTHFGMGG